MKEPTQWPGPEAPLADGNVHSVLPEPIFGVRYAWSNEADLGECAVLAPSLVCVARFNVYPLWVPYLINDPVRRRFLALAAADAQLQVGASMALDAGPEMLLRYVDIALTEIPNG